MKISYSIGNNNLLHFESLYIIHSAYTSQILFITAK